MAVALETVVKQLEDSGIVAPGKLENFVPPKAHPTSVEALVAELVKENHLTRFQAAQVAAGRSKSLILGGYTILDKIGAGGMGQVFKALHRRMERVVAIKMLPTAMMKDAAAAARFQREVVAAAKLSHPNIVAAHDAAEANGVHFLVMEYVEGQDLSALVKKNGPFPVAKAVNFVLQAARGLEFAHGEGVVHRDIKPANLLLDKKGTVKILDMGLARIESPGAAQAELTGTGAVMGTVDYMSPEQAFNTKDADARADIYSLGCSLYYLVTGKATYGGQTVVEKILAHREKPIPSLMGEQPSVSDELEVVFKKLIAKKIEDRYQTMTDVIGALERLGGNSGTVGNPMEATAALDGGALAALKGIQVTPTLHRTKATKKVAPVKAGEAKQPPWKNTKVLIGAALLGVLILAGIIVSLRTKDGTLIVEIDQPDAMVQVLDAEGKVEVSQKGGVGRVTISVDPGKHRLRVEKDGFVLFGQEFEMEKGGEKTITAKLEAVKAVVAAGQPKKPWNTPAFQQWMKDVQVMSTEQQAQAVGNKLIELNPRLEGPITHHEENGEVTKLEFDGTYVLDISPVRAFKALSDLRCNGNGRTGMLADLSPLQGMNLTFLSCAISRVKDLSPLRGMLLNTLNVSYSMVDDISPLEGMPLNELNLISTQVSSLPPLTGSSIVTLRISNTRVSDISLLPAFNKLVLLQARNTQITSSSFAALQKALPNCKIEWDDPAKAKSPAPAAPLGPAPPLAKAPFDAAQAKAHQEAWAKHLGIEVETPNSVGMKMVLIPPGEFMMGSTDEQVAEALKITEEGRTLDRISRNERPRHRVVISKPFCIAMTEVNVRQYKTFCAAIGYRTEAEKSAKDASSKSYLHPEQAVGEESPAAMITWNDAVAFCQWLSEQEKVTYRLPTEAEWEYACRSGTETQYSFGDDVALLEQFGWYEKNSQNVLHPVGTRSANNFGLHDMHGSLYEWCQDLYHEKFFELAALSTDPKGPATGSQRVVRGGIWSFNAAACRSAFRHYENPWHPSKTNGFRIVRELAAPSTTASVTPQPTIPATAPSKPITDFNSPEFQAWKQEVQRMSAEEQIKAVSKKLMELNPGFDGKMTEAEGKSTPKVENGVVTSIGFSTNNVTDVSPLCGMVGLKALNCSGRKLSDLSPLKGMKLSLLQCDGTKVDDLSPLMGMPLTTLKCGGTPVSDLTPLKGMPLKHLWLHMTQVSDLSPLQGMPLYTLNCEGTAVLDLSPLKGMTLLGTLMLHNTKINDLSNLKGLPISQLQIYNTLVSDLSPLEGCKSLRSLDIKQTKVTPASVAALQKALPNCKIEWDDPKATTPAPPSSKLFMDDPAFPQWMKDVQAMPAEEQIQAVSKKLMELNPGFEARETHVIENNVCVNLHIEPNTKFPIRDASPIRALIGLKRLTVRGRDLNDLTPLAGLQIENLSVNSTSVSDLSPLLGMPLTVLNIDDTKVADFMALREMPLKSLNADGCLVSDLSPLQGMELTHVHVSNTSVTDLSPLLKCPKLTYVDVQKTKVTASSVAALQKAGPTHQKFAVSKTLSK